MNPWFNDKYPQVDMLPEPRRSDASGFGPVGRAGLSAHASFFPGGITVRQRDALRAKACGDFGLTEAEMRWLLGRTLGVTHEEHVRRADFERFMDVILVDFYESRIFGAGLGPQSKVSWRRRA